PGRGDRLGVGARRFSLGLAGQTAPDRLGAWLNVNDRVSSDSTVEAGRWSHVAMTCEPVVGSGECGCIRMVGVLERV
ncbi:MAG: hypothetical protein ACK57O_10050, partial [Planctomyces sp.]